MSGMIVAAADGSSLSNPGPAGWAWYVSDDIWAAGGWKQGTNNMGELMAVLDLLQSTAHRSDELRVLCDSQYVINSLTKWLPGWKRRGWKKGDGKPVLNVELMKQLDQALAGRNVEFEWVKGHAGHEMNEAADQRARAAATSFRDGTPLDAGPGFPAARPTARQRSFKVGDQEREPDLFSIPTPDAEPAPVSRLIAGSASSSVKNELAVAFEELVGSSGLGKLSDAFIAYSGEKNQLSASQWLARLGGEPDAILSIDTPSLDVAVVRTKNTQVHLMIWLRETEGWLLAQAQEFPSPPSRRA